MEVAMKMTLMKKPCADCPFRSDKPFHLPSSRGREIATALRRDGTFSCHKTCDYSGEQASDADGSFCAGAAGTMVNGGEHFGNVAIRMLYLSDEAATKDQRWPNSIERDNLYGSLEEWIEALEHLEQGDEDDDC